MTLSEKDFSAPDPVWRRTANVSRAFFAHCLAEARSRSAARDFDVALQWCSVAAWAASGKGWFGELSSAELEAELLHAAQQLPVPSRKSAAAGRPRWLHVMSEAYATLGHTNLCRRWIQFDPTVTHDVLLLNQRSETPANLEAAVQQAGGRCVVLDAAAPPMERAAALRQYAWENADVVVLHTHPDEVAATVAFGVAGGPPVVFMNHADHVFWVGCSVADLVLEIRMSGHLWTKQHRGVAGSEILPIPLVAAGGHAPDLPERKALRRSLGIPDEAVVLLTVGSPAKYAPMPGLDFVAAAREILQANPGTYLVAVGPRDIGDWAAAKLATNGRVLAVGYQRETTRFCNAADLYIEGFPLGSLTALLEAGEAGLPCVLAPGVPPFICDSLSLAACPQGTDVPDYVQKVTGLIRAAAARAASGRELQQTIRSQHCGAGWLARLEEIKRLIPVRHQVSPDFKPSGVVPGMCDWFLKCLASKSAPPTVSALAERLFAEAWRRTGVNPQVTLALWTELYRLAGEQNESSGAAAAQMLEQLNQRIKGCGESNRTLDAIRDAIRQGRNATARRLLYRRLAAHPGCLLEATWLRPLAKAHLGAAWSRRLKGGFRSRAVVL